MLLYLRSNPIQGSTILYLVIVIVFSCTLVCIKELVCQSGCIAAKNTNAYAIESQTNNAHGAHTMVLIGKSVDEIPKIAEVKRNSVTTTTFIAPDNNQSTRGRSPEFNSIMYSAKFVCGSIIGNQGPLRPGHYDTDISIYNKQKYPLKILWNAVVNNGSTTNAIIETLQPESAKGIICKDLTYLLNFGNNTKDLIEGFLIIKVPLGGDVLSTTSNNAAGGYILQSANKDQLDDLIDVQAFYTANSLDRIAHATIIDKITFTILHDLSGKIPRTLLQKPLDISIPSELNTVYDEISRIRSFMAERFSLSNAESNNLELRIERTSVGVENSIDDHAISLFSVRPQGTNNN